ncbi:hypothetical protein ULT26_004308 [Salmonella enterica]|nr:hypothetical protein [Salmonella enterica]
MAKRILVQAGVHGPHPEGQYVSYADYAELQKERNRLKVHLDALAYSVLNAPLSPDTEELAREVFDG